MLVVRLVSTVMNELKRARERKEERKREREMEEQRGREERVKKKITANKNARREKKK